MRSLYSPRDGGKSIEIGRSQVKEAVGGLLDDLSVVFETLLLLLPATQVKLLDCLALYPTDSPHSESYTKEHGLPRGGGIQSALEGLEKKGLIYGADYKYRIALPLLSKWIKQRLELEERRTPVF